MLELFVTAAANTPTTTTFKFPIAIELPPAMLPLTPPSTLIHMQVAVTAIVEQVVLIALNKLFTTTIISPATTAKADTLATTVAVATAIAIAITELIIVIAVTRFIAVSIVPLWAGLLAAVAGLVVVAELVAATMLATELATELVVIIIAIAVLIIVAPQFATAVIIIVGW
jgi:hypothetical protein